MSMLARPARLPWWAAVALLALGARLLFLFAADEPFCTRIPTTTFHGALAILEHPDPWRFIGTSDAWHLWLGPWTIAPLYYLFLAGIMAVFGPHLLAVQLVQIGLDVLAAVLTGHSAGVWPDRAARGRGGLCRELPRDRAVHDHAHREPQQRPPARRHRDADRGGAQRRRGWWAAAGGLLLGLSSLAPCGRHRVRAPGRLWRWSVGRDRAALMRAL
jgi:hypothetical protein